jgi:hypothetical protein
MMNFRSLNQEESNKVWDKFYDLFDFKPSVNTFPAVKTTTAQLKFDIKDCFSSDYPFDKLEQLALNIFDKISKPGERLYALDWQHECYDFDSRQDMDRNEFGEWIIPIFPNGEYYIFLTKDFNNIWFGHPWEQTITLIGDNIVKFGRQIKEDIEGIKITCK